MNINGEIRFRIIGVIHSQFKVPEGTPIQPVFAEDCAGQIEIFEQFAEGLKDLAGFDRVWLLYAWHLASHEQLSVVPFRDTVERGVFATRAPCRPNPLGMSCVRLQSVKRNTGCPGRC